MKTLLLILSLALTFVMPGFSQFGEIRGIVTDKKTGLPLEGATVAWRVAGTLKGTTTNSMGEYKIKPLTAGLYDLESSYVLYKPQPIKEVAVSAEKITYLNFALEPNNELPVVDITWEPPMVDPGVTSTMTTLSSEDIKHAATRDIRDQIASAAGVFQREENGSVNVRGSRDNATLYVVDGIRMTGGFSLPNSAIAEITIITGGIPAQFGDATGGVVLITTKSYRK